MISSIRLSSSGLKLWRSSVHQLVLQLLERLVAPRVRLDAVGPQVRGHDHDGVPEVDGAALAVREASVLEQLQEDVEDVGMRLLDLVEQQHRVGAPAHGLGELAGLLVADVARRRADQARHGVALLELAHVEPDHRVLVAEQRLGERPRELGLADAGRPEEEERADRPVRVAQPRARAPDRAGDRLDGLVLPDHALVELRLEAEQALALLLGQLCDRDAGAARHDLGDVVGEHLGGALASAGAALVELLA